LLAGLLAVWIAIGSPLAALDHQSLTIHMVKHFLLMTVGAPLILVGTPALPRLQNFVWCWLAGAAAVVGWHFPPAFHLAMHSQGWHHLENASFLLAGLLFWWPVVQPGAGWSVPLYLFLATLPCDILSAFLVFCGRVVYPSTHAAQPLFHWSPLQDQEFAGALMWVSVTLIYLIPAVVITVQLLSPRVRLEAEGIPSY
jgi:putative membrane protein